jgi:hypothetical protein
MNSIRRIADPDHATFQVFTTNWFRSGEFFENLADEISAYRFNPVINVSGADMESKVGLYRFIDDQQGPKAGLISVVRFGEPHITGRTKPSNAAQSREGSSWSLASLSICIHSTVKTLCDRRFAECASPPVDLLGCAASHSQLSLIQRDASGNCASLSSICLHSSVQRLCESCFQSCTSLLLVRFADCSFA